jgi:hypothetical protein
LIQKKQGLAFIVETGAKRTSDLAKPCLNVLFLLLAFQTVCKYTKQFVISKQLATIF